jgi:hypothetical protein
MSDDSDPNWGVDPGYQLDLTMPISLSLDWEYNKPRQHDLFRHHIQGQWLHNSHLADEDPQWQVEAFIKQNPYLKELQQLGVLEIDSSDEYFVDYYHKATAQEHFAWRIRWSEHLNQKTSYGML